MTESIVRVSMQDDNDLNCSYAIISKTASSIILILKDQECAIFDYANLRSEDFTYHYLLLKHFDSNSKAYVDFLKLIGKMCKKDESSKYFLNHIKEENRMVVFDQQKEHMITQEESVVLEDRFTAFREFVLSNRDRF